MKAVYINLATLACLGCLMVDSATGQGFTTPVFSSPKYFVQFTDAPPARKELLPIPGLSSVAPATSAPVEVVERPARAQTIMVVPASLSVPSLAAPKNAPAAAAAAAALNANPAMPTVTADPGIPAPVPAVAGPTASPEGAATPGAQAVLTPPTAPPGAANVAAETPGATATPRALPTSVAASTLDPTATVGTPADAPPSVAPAEPAPRLAKTPTQPTLNRQSSRGRPILGTLRSARARPVFFEGIFGSSLSESEAISRPVGNSIEEIEMLAEGCDTCIDCPSAVWPHKTSMSGSGTYLRFRNADVAYGVPVDGPISSILSSPIQVGQVGVVDPDHETGYEISGNFALNPLTSVAVNYLTLDSTTSNRIGTDAPNVIRSLVAHPSSSSAAADFLNASADLYLQMNVLDVSLRHLFVGGEVFAVNYFGGARYARLEQQFDSVFVDNGTEQVSTDIDFDGAGLTLGLEAERDSCTSCFRVYGRGAASFLAGKFQASYHQGQSFDPTVVDTSWQAGRIIPILDLELGAGWRSKCGRIKVSGGYMVSAWFNTVKTEDFIDAVQLNDFNHLYHTLTIDGVVGRVEIGF